MGSCRIAGSALNGVGEQKMEAIDVPRATTVYVPDRIRREIKLRGMTVTGAFLTGWDAIEGQRKYAAQIEQLTTETVEMQRNIRGYQRMIQDLLDKGKKRVE